MSGFIESRRNATSHVADARLYRSWMWCGLAAFLASLALTATVPHGVDGLDLTVGDRNSPGAVFAATLGVPLLGGVVGWLQALVGRARVPVPRRPRITANAGKGLFGWLSMVTPPLMQDHHVGEDLQLASMPAVSQTLALGPLLRLKPAAMPCAYTPGRVWWIATNVMSQWNVDLAGGVAQQLNSFDSRPGNLATAARSLTPAATTPVTGCALMWLLSPSAGSKPALAATS